MAKSVLEWTLVARDKASNEFERVGRSADRMGGLVKGAAFAAGAALAATAIAAVKFATDSVQAFAEAETAQVRLNFAFEKFPALVGGNVDALRKLNTELQKTTRFEDDAIAAAQGTLAQYDLTAQQLTELTPLMLDYAAATGRDVSTAAEDLGKALLGQGRALKAVGIDFQDAGNPAANYAQLIAGLSEKVQGFAEKDADTLAGKLDTIKNRFGDVQEVFGEGLKPLADGALEFVDGSLLPAAERIADAFGQAGVGGDFDALLPKLDLLVDKLTEAAVEALPDLIDGLNGAVEAGTALVGLFSDPGQTLFGFEGSNTLGAFEDPEFLAEVAADPAAAGRDYYELLAEYDARQYAETMEAQSGILYNAGKELTDSALAGAASQLGAASEGLGQNLAQGMASGISKYEYLALLAAENMALRTVEKVRNTMQIKSPSKVMHALGAFTVEGFAEGIDASAWRASDSIGRMLNLGTPSAMRAPAVGVGGLGMSGGVTVNVRVDGNVLGTDASIGRAVTTGVVNAIRQGQVNPVEFTRALGI